MNWKTGAFKEQGLGTADPQPWLDLLLGPGGWECRWEGAASEQPLWPAAMPRPDHEWLLSRPGTDTGAVRLFHFSKHTPLSRVDAMAWDTGGFFDIDLRVARVDEWTQRLSAPCWSGFSEPINWRLGELKVREWLVRGPDGVVLALIERLDPPLDPPAGPGLGHAFNATQTVRDMDKTIAFYQALGFDVLARHSGPLKDGGGAVLGLAIDEADSLAVELAILSTNNELNGSIELLALAGRPGRDLSAATGPGCLGLNIMRIPVRGLDALCGDLQQNNRVIEKHARWEIQPYGLVHGIAVRTPDGAWLEFFEVE